MARSSYYNISLVIARTATLVHIVLIHGTPTTIEINSTVHILHESVNGGAVRSSTVGISSPRRDLLQRL